MIYIFLSASQLPDDSQYRECKGFLWVHFHAMYLEPLLLSQVFLNESRTIKQ